MTQHWLDLANQWLEVTRQFLWPISDSTMSWLWLEGLVTLTRLWFGHITGNFSEKRSRVNITRYFSHACQVLKFPWSRTISRQQLPGFPDWLECTVSEIINLLIWSQSKWIKQNGTEKEHYYYSCENALYPNVTTHAFQQISDLKIFCECFCGPLWKHCDGPYAARRPVFGPHCFRFNIKMDKSAVERKKYSKN